MSQPLVGADVGLTGHRGQTSSACEHRVGRHSPTPRDGRACRTRAEVRTRLAGQSWVRAAEKLDLPFLCTGVVGEKGTEGLYASWASLREIHEAVRSSCALTGYTAWRQRAATWDDEAVTQFQATLDSALGTTY
jgi:hypothetical protein